MSYKIKVTKRFEKDFKKFGKKRRNVFINKIKEIEKKSIFYKKIAWKTKRKIFTQDRRL